jgi:hypothetical protein
MTTTDTRDGVMSHRIGSDGLLIVSVHDGDVRLHGVDGDRVTFRGTDGGSADLLEIEPGDRSLSIRARVGLDLRNLDLRSLGRDRGRRRGHGRAKDLELDVPAGATVDVEAASADIKAGGLHGDQRYRSASGDIVLREVHGSVTIEALSGDIDISADGPATIAARSVSGDLRVRAGSVSELRATTTSGDLHIAARFDGAGPYAIETVSGDALLTTIDSGARIEGRTITGDIETELPSRREDMERGRALIVGDGGPTITFRSTSGDLAVVADDPAVPAPSHAVVDRDANPEDAADQARLAVLRDLERGAIDVAEADRRLEEIDLSTTPDGPDAGDEEDDHA